MRLRSRVLVLWWRFFNRRMYDEYLYQIEERRKAMLEEMTKRFIQEFL